MEKKYKTEKVGNMLRIIALKDFSDVKKGDKGGLIEKEENLSQEGDCWVYDEAWIYGNAVISDNAKIYEKASVGGIARVFGCACVYGDATVCDNAWVHGNARIYGKAVVHGIVNVYENAEIYGKASVERYAEIFGEAKIYGRAWVSGKACDSDNEPIKICGNVKLYSTKRSWVTTSIKDSKDYVILAIKKDFYIISLSNNIINQDISIVEENYIKNIQIIRQLYGKEV